MKEKRLLYWVVPALSGVAAALALAIRTQSAPPPAPQGEWPMYQMYASHNAVFKRDGFRANWVHALGDRINGGLAVAGNTVYAVSFDRKLYALDDASGHERWSAQTDDILMSTPVLAGGIVVVGTGHNGFLKPNDADSQIWGRPEGNDFLGFSASDGHLLWKYHTVGQNMPTPAISANTLVFANGDLHAYALDVQNGAVRWQVPLPGVATMASATVSNGAVFVSTCHNAPYVCETRALRLSDGQTLWTNPYGGSDCTPAVADGLVFVNANRDDGRRFHTGGVDIVAAIDQRTGRTRWTYTGEPGPYTFPASNERQIAGTVSDGALYQPIGNASRVIAFDARSGKVRWSLRTWANVKMSPVVSEGRVYFGDVSGVLYNVDARTGRVIHTLSFMQAFSTSPPVIVGQTLFIADGSLVVAMPLDWL